ncbi:hypothetical protein IFM89_001778 [Coptis chinensis]|uniref:RNA polymerase-associated protein CTR9-like protein n=1 Tax=Coptis chinensis TaxID=261450 RepID=A0A835HK80_9MAGN|nr:hypothetical protein IFM89_001778 [Coptis chinensis]
MGCVYIPVQHSDEEVRVVLNQLPLDANDILDILKAEQASLDLWLIIAREYFKQGYVEQFQQILEEGSSPEIDEYYADVKYDRIAILNALGAYHSYLGKCESKGAKKDDHFISATKYYNKASRIDIHEPSTWVGKGQLLLAKGDLEQASGAFKIVLDGNKDNVPALLGQACVQFSRGRYSDSLELYKRALKVYPSCPGAVRLGIGLCRYKLGQFDKARQAFQRVLQASELDPDNVEALVALGLMDLQINKGDEIQKGMEKMQAAFEIYPYCAVALIYLANHFFFTGRHHAVERLTDTALAVSEPGLQKSHSFYNLARSYHTKGDYEKAGFYYMASVKEISRPHDFVLPYYGLGQVQLKLGDFRGSLSNFEKVLEVYPENGESLRVVGHIYVQLGQTEKALDVLRKATRIDPRDAQAFLELGELLISSDAGAALDAFKTTSLLKLHFTYARHESHLLASGNHFMVSQARSLLKKSGGKAPIELLNNIGVLHFDKGDFELAKQTFKEALGNGVWLDLVDGKFCSSAVDSDQFCDMQLFQRLQERGDPVELQWDKVTTLFNYARLLEQLHDAEKASILYRLILFKYPDYQDAYLRLAAIAKSRNNIQLSIELIGEAIKVNEKCPDALSMLGALELKNDDWLKAKETFRAAREATDGKDSYSALSLGNWNYFAAARSEKKGAKLEATHLEKAKELYTKVLVQHPANLYAANGAAVVLAEKGQFDVSKEIFTQVQEAASGSIFVQMPDYQNCLRKFYYNTDTQVLLYLARTHYEAEQWQDCKKTLLRAIHLAPSNYTLRFDAGVALQKFSASTLQKTKRTADEVSDPISFFSPFVRSTVAELKNAVRVFSQLSAASNHHIHGFDEKKIETHVGYCKHLLDAAKVHCEAAEREELQNRQRLEVARQVALAEEARRKAEEQRKYQLEKRKQEDEIKQVRQQEEQFERKKEQWKSSTPASKRKDRSHADDEEGGHSENRRRKGGKRRKRDKKPQYEMDEVEPNTMYEDDDDMDDIDTNLVNNHEKDKDQMNRQENDGEENTQDLLAAAGLEDSDVEDDMNDPPSTKYRRKRALSDSDEDEPSDRKAESGQNRESLAEPESDGEFREKEELHRDTYEEDED